MNVLYISIIFPLAEKISLVWLYPVPIGSHNAYLIN